MPSSSRCDFELIFRLRLIEMTGGFDQGMPMTKTTDRAPVTASRRRFLREGAVAGGAVLAGGLVRDVRAEGSENLPPNVPEWMKTPGEEMGSQPYGTPSPFEKGVVKNIPKNLKQRLSIVEMRDESC